MNKYSYFVPLFLLVGLIVLLFFFIVFIKNSFYLANKEKYSFMNRFPFESIYQKNNRLRSIYFVVLSFLMLLCVAINVLYIFMFTQHASSLGYAIFIALLFILNVVCSLAVFVVTPKNYRLFKTYSVLAIVFGILSNCTLGIFSVSGVFDHYSFKIIGGLAFVISATNIVLAFNPKLKDWEKLTEDTNSDGTIIYVRPKISPLAFTLWLNNLLLIIGEVLIIISMFLVSTVLG